MAARFNTPDREGTRFYTSDRSGTQIGILEISRRTHMSAAHISKVFSGQRQPSLAAAALIATALRISIDELYMRLVKIQDQASKVSA